MEYCGYKGIMEKKMETLPTVYRSQQASKDYEHAMEQMKKAHLAFATC